MKQSVKCHREATGIRMPRVDLTGMIRLLRLVVREDVANQLCELVKGELPLFGVGLICPQLLVVADEPPSRECELETGR
jgi:hypothetical protein